MSNKRIRKKQAKSKCYYNAWVQSPVTHVSMPLIINRPRLRQIRKALFRGRPGLMIGYKMERDPDSVLGGVIGYTIGLESLVFTTDGRTVSKSGELI